MSKKIGLQIFSALTMITLLVAPLSVAQTIAQQPTAATAVAPANTRGAAIAATTAEVLEETSKIRELPVLRPVASGAQSRAEIERMIVKNMDEETTPEELRASELALKKLGLVPPDFQYRTFLIKLLTEQVAGYYDTKEREFFLADWIDLDGQKPVMAHELTHALQDQHFDLRRFDKWPKGDSDAELAAHALIEGDATLLMMRYIMSDPKRAVSFLKSVSNDQSGSELIDGAPRVIRESLLFPYEQGLQWVSQVYGRGGWKMVSQAYTDLPQSTEQILHADKYFAREAPVKIALPDVGALLGAKWKRIDYDVNGEWSYYLILDEYLKSSDESEQAAAGWGGDRYAIYEGANPGELLLMQMTAWDTPKDALEFFNAYVKRTERRYGLTANDNAGGQTQMEWRTSEGRVSIERVGSRVLILEGVTDKTDIAKLKKAVWQTVDGQKR